MSTSIEDEETAHLIPPKPLRVYRRALVLAALVCRADIERDAESEEFRRDVIRWLHDSQVTIELEDAEREILEKPIGHLSEEEMINCSWRSEGLAVLGWSLRAIELPPYDQQVVASEIAEKLGFMQELRDQQIVLRPRTEIEYLGELMFTLHWRLRQFSIDKRPMDFVSFAREAWFGPLETRGLRFVENDLAIEDKPIFKAEWRDLLSIASERHQAVNWLLGHDPIYSEVSADT